MAQVSKVLLVLIGIAARWQRNKKTTTKKQSEINQGPILYKIKEGINLNCMVIIVGFYGELDSTN